MTKVNENYENEELDLDEEDMEEEEEETTSEIEIREEYGITADLVKENFESHFEDNDEITFKNYTVALLECDNGKFHVIKPNAEKEEGYETLTKSQFKNREAAVKYAVKELIKYSKNREVDGSIKKAKATSASSSSSEPKYDGPRIVRVFGRDIYIEEDTSLKFEDIRIKLVEEHGLPNFKKDKVCFDFDESTGVLECLLKLQPKG